MILTAVRLLFNFVRDHAFICQGRALQGSAVVLQHRTYSLVSAHLLPILLLYCAGEAPHILHLNYGDEVQA